MLLNSLNRNMFNNFALIEVCSVEFWVVCLRICTGYIGDFFRETHLWEQFGQTGKIALITCLKKIDVSGAFLKNMCDVVGGFTWNCGCAPQPTRDLSGPTARPPLLRYRVSLYLSHPCFSGIARHRAIGYSPPKLAPLHLRGEGGTGYRSSSCPLEGIALYRGIAEIVLPIAA